MKLKNLEIGNLNRVATEERYFSFLIGTIVDVHEEYILLCSFRRGLTSEAL